MTNMLFIIEYCIIDFSDYVIKIEKNHKKQFEVRIWHIYARIFDCNLSEYDTLTSWDGIIILSFYITQ